MSDTPITDKACGWPVGHHGRIDSSDLKLSPDGPFVHSSVARELERENAALKAALDAQMKYQKELRTDRDRLDWLEEQYRREQKSYSNVETEESALTNEVRLLFYTEDKKVVSFAAPSFRAALDAAMEEAK